MKKIIIEASSDKVEKMIQTYLNSKTYENVCETVVNYNGDENTFVINILFQKGTTDRLSERQIAKIINQSLGGIFQGVKFRYYSHHGTC